MIDPLILPQLLQTLVHQAEADAAPYRERPLITADILAIAAEFTNWRLPPDETVEGNALRACYLMVFQVTATPPGHWQVTLPYAPV
jgi:hypothetical protein